jgi:Sel1 repeat
MFNHMHRCILSCFVILLFSVPVAAQSDDAEQQLLNADMLYTEKDYSSARAAYLQHVDKLSPDQQLRLGITYIVTSKTPESAPREAMQWVNKAAEAGSTEAMNTLVYCYQAGWGVAADTVKVIYWLTRSAAAGSTEGMCTLAHCYDNGIYVNMDKIKAKELYTRAAAGNHPKAMYRLAVMELDRSNTQAFISWLRKSANAGYIPAMLKLGKCYETGSITTGMSLDEAARWYRKIDNKRDYNFPNERREAAERLEAIGRVEPSTDIDQVKPLLMKLVAAHGDDYSDVTGVETSSPEETVDYIFISDYYTCTVDLGFKNALIRKKNVKEINVGNYHTEASIHYSYSADIVHSAEREQAEQVFNTWVSILKKIFPGWESRKGDDKDRPFFSLSSRLSNGKNVRIYLELCCPGTDAKSVAFTIE